MGSGAQEGWAVPGVPLSPLEKPHRRFLVSTTRAEDCLEQFLQMQLAWGRAQRMPKHRVHFSLRAATDVGACAGMRESVPIQRYACGVRGKLYLCLMRALMNVCVCMSVQSISASLPVIVMVLNYPGSASTEWEWEPEEG